jgi:hypothetical protein
LAAIALKLTGSTAAEVATVSADSRGGGEGLERKSATIFFYSICTLSSEMKANWLVEGAKWGQKHVTKLSRVVCDQFKAGQVVLHKNDKNVELQLKLPTIHGQKWSSKTPCQSNCGKRNQEVANGHLNFAA